MEGFRSGGLDSALILLLATWTQGTCVSEYTLVSLCYLERLRDMRAIVEIESNHQAKSELKAHTVL